MIVGRILGEQLKLIGKVAQRAGLWVSEDRAGRQRRQQTRTPKARARTDLEPDCAVEYLNSHISEQTSSPRRRPSVRM